MSQGRTAQQLKGGRTAESKGQQGLHRSRTLANVWGMQMRWRERRRRLAQNNTPSSGGL